MDKLTKVFNLHYMFIMLKSLIGSTGKYRKNWWMRNCNKVQAFIKVSGHPNASNKSGINSIGLKFDIPSATRKTKQINFRAIHKENHRS